MTAETEAIQQMKIDMANIKKDISHISATVIKMDASFQNIIDLNRNMAVQESKFKALEERFLSHQGYIKNKLDQETLLREKVEQRIISLEETSKSERRENHKELVEKLDEFSANLKSELVVTKKIVDKHDHYMWYMMGIGAVIMFILSVIPVWEIVSR